MGQEMENGVCSLRPVSISYWDLKDKEKDLSAKIKEGFGPDGLGIITVTDVPDYPLLRRNLLELAPRLADIPEHVRKQIGDPKRPDKGLNLGNDKFDDGNDASKASFFANPVIDVPTTDPYLIKKYPHSCEPNLWPKDALPEFEVGFKALGKLMQDVGLLVAYHCDRYVSKQATKYENDGLEEILQRSKCHKARVIYYYPNPKQSEDSSCLTSWCGWHTDWDSLTALTAGMFIKNDEIVENPDSSAGLYIRTQKNQLVRVLFGDDEIAYQMGETTEILSKGLLCATPHSVRAAGGKSAEGVGRAILVLFMQPNWDEVLKFPEVMPYHQELVAPNENLAFGDYTERRIRKYSMLKP